MSRGLDALQQYGIGKGSGMDTMQDMGNTPHARPIRITQACGTRSLFWRHVKTGMADMWYEVFVKKTGMWYEDSCICM